MANFIKLTDVTFLANPNSQIKEQETIVINTNVITDIRTEFDRYSFKDNVCTVIRVSNNKWGYIVKESMEEILALIENQ